MQRDPSDLARFIRELSANAALANAITNRPDMFPPLPPESDRVIRCSRANADRAVCRVLARAVLRPELWRIELGGMSDEKSANGGR